MLTLICFSIMHLFQCCVVCMISWWMYEVWERRRMSFNCFSLWEFLQGVQWTSARCALMRVWVLSQKAQERYHCSHTSRSAGEAQSRAKCVQAGWSFRTYQLRGKVEGLLLQRVHRVKDSNNQRLFESLSQGERAGILLESWVYKWNLKRVRTCELFQRETKVELFHRNQVQEGRMPSRLAKIPWEVESDGWISSGGSAKIPWTIGSLRTVKRLILSVFSTPLSSRGIVTARSRLMWVVDLACELAY